jgi:hypothetical protein
MKTKGEVLKVKKLTILVIVAVISALICFGGRQVLSNKPPKPPKPPAFQPNYSAVFEDHIEGEGEVEWGKGGDIISDPDTEDFPLYFETTGDVNWDAVSGQHFGWLKIRKASGSTFFQYTWSDEDPDTGDVRNFHLLGYGTFSKTTGKEKTFTFISAGEYELVEWFYEPPYAIRQYVYPVFTISGTPL